MKKIILCLIAILVLSVTAFAEELKVYTNKDLGSNKKTRDVPEQKKIKPSPAKTDSYLSDNPENIIKSRLKEPETWRLRSFKYKDGIIICGTNAYWNKLLPVWYAKGEKIYVVNGAANSINTMEYEFVSSENSPELGTSISKIVAVCEK